MRINRVISCVCFLCKLLLNNLLKRLSIITMKKVGLDTSFFNLCYEKGITAERLAKAFKELNYVPHVCIYVTYELARCFQTNNISKGMALFQLIRELNSEFITKRDILYDLEYLKLKNGRDVSFVADESLVKLIKERIQAYSYGILDIPGNYIDLRQKSLKDLKTAWAPKGAKKTLRDRFDGSFQRLIDNFFSLILEGDQYRIDYAKKIILLATEGNVFLSNKEIATVVSQNSDFPVLNTSIRSYAYLNFLTEINATVPREDRFTDSLIMIEYAYCDVILSNDKMLVDKHAGHINPRIKLIDAEEFINNISTVFLLTDAVT